MTEPENVWRDPTAASYYDDEPAYRDELGSALAAVATEYAAAQAEVAGYDGTASVTAYLEPVPRIEAAPQMQPTPAVVLLDEPPVSAPPAPGPPAAAPPQSAQRQRPQTQQPTQRPQPPQPNFRPAPRPAPLPTSRRPWPMVSTPPTVPWQEPVRTVPMERRAAMERRAPMERRAEMPRTLTMPTTGPSPARPLSGPSSGRQQRDARSRVVPPGGKRSKASWGWVPGVLVLAVVIFLGNGGPGLIKRLVNRGDVPSGVSTAVNAYYDAAAEKNLATAEINVCSTGKAAWEQAQKTASGDTRRGITDHRITAKDKKGSAYQVTVDVVTGTTTTPATLTVVEQSGAYRVCSGYN